MSQAGGERLPIEAHAEGVVLIVQAHPAARSNGLGPVVGGALKVRVTAAPEKGKANRALREVIADGLGLRKSQVELLTGETSQSKRFLLRSVTVDQVRQLLTDCGAL